MNQEQVIRFGCSHTDVQSSIVLFDFHSYYKIQMGNLLSFLNRGSKIVEHDNQSIPTSKQNGQNEQPHEEQIVPESQIQTSDFPKQHQQQQIEEDRSHDQDIQPIAIHEPNVTNLQLATDRSKSKQISPLLTTRSDAYSLDPQNALTIFTDLIASSFPVSQLKQICLQQRRKILIVWMKQNPVSDKQRARDAILRTEGYQIFSTDQISSVFSKYEQDNQTNARAHFILLYSYSSSFKNMQMVEQLYQYFIEKGKLSHFIIIKPSQQDHYQSCSTINRSSNQIIQISYQIEMIRLKLIQLQSYNYPLSVNWLPLQYWDNDQGVVELIKIKQKLVSTAIKTKLSLAGCLTIGDKIVNKIQTNKDYFKGLVYNYQIMHDIYFKGSKLVTPQEKKQNYLQRMGIKMLQDPLSFYCSFSHQLLINKFIKFNGEDPSIVNNIVLPLRLVFDQIKEQFRKDNSSKSYRNQFICFYEVQMEEEKLKMFETGTVIQNLGFIKANLKESKTKEGEYKPNVIFIIAVNSTQKQDAFDNGYCFRASSPEEQQNKGKKYFSGFKFVLFNLFNTFKVIDHRIQKLTAKHTIELQYGYAVSQIKLKQYQNFIQQKQNILARKNRQLQQADEQTVIKFNSNCEVLQRIQDYGDCVSLLGSCNEAIRYYDQLFRRHKCEMAPNGLLLANIQIKKALNYERSNSPSTALQYYYNAFNFLHHGKLTIDLQQLYLKVMRNLNEEHSFDKAIRYGINIYNNAQTQNNLHLFQAQFRLKLYTQIAEGYYQQATYNFQLKQQQSNAILFYQKAIHQIQTNVGQFNDIVPTVYYNMGKFYLTSRKPFQGLIYLNKSLLIKKSIYSQKHPHLCPILQLLTVAYIAMHDYQKAFRSISDCIDIYKLYYHEKSRKFLIPLELKGKIYGLMNNMIKAVQTLQIEALLIGQLSKLKMYKQKQQRTFRIMNDSIGLFNTIEHKQLIPAFQCYYREDRAQICLVYVYLHLAFIQTVQYNFEKTATYLTLASKLNYQEMGEAHLLNIKIIMMQIQVKLAVCNWSDAAKLLKDLITTLTKTRRQNGLEGAKYHQLTARMHEWKGDYVNSLKSYTKYKESIFKLFGKFSLQNCEANDHLGRINLKLKNINQAKMSYEQAQKNRRTMLGRIQLNPKSSQLFGSDLLDYIRKIKMGICSSIENNALLLFTIGKSTESLAKYEQALNQAIQHVGQYHPQTANIYKQLGKISHSMGLQHFNNSLSYLKRSLSILKSIPIYDQKQLVQVHCLTAVTQQSQNQLALSLEQLGQAITVMRKITYMQVTYQDTLQNYSRLLGIIIANPSLQHLKIAYYTTIRLFDAERDGKMQNIKNKNDQIVVNAIVGILQKNQEVRKKIEELGINKEDENLEEQLKRFENGNGTVNINEIKKNVQIRKKIRQKGKESKSPTKDTKQ